MNKAQCLQKFKNAANSGDEVLAITTLYQFRVDYMDMYFIREEFSREFTTLLYDQFEPHAEIWEQIYAAFARFKADRGKVCSTVSPILTLRNTLKRFS